MQRIFFILVSVLLSLEYTFAVVITDKDIGFTRNGNNLPDGSILTSNGITLIKVLTLVQSVLLKVVLPIVVVGASLYIAYELFTAEGDESRMKKAWKSVAYSAVALISIALSYGLVSIVSRLSF